MLVQHRLYLMHKGPLGPVLRHLDMPPAGPEGVEQEAEQEQVGDPVG